MYSGYKYDDDDFMSSGKEAFCCFMSTAIVDANERTPYYKISIFSLSSKYASIKIYITVISLFGCFSQEIWNCPYAPEHFNKYAEVIDAGDASPTISMLSEVAYSQGITIIGGSIPETSAARLFNTCCVIGPDGKLKAKHRKVSKKFSLFIYLVISNLKISMLLFHHFANNIILNTSCCFMFLTQ